MQEDAVDVYLRHRTELIKAIFDDTDPSQEVGDFILSTINLHNHGIEYDLNDKDMVALSYSDYFMKQQKPRGRGPAHQREPRSRANYRPALMMGYAADHAFRGRVKRHWNKSDNEKHGYGFFKEQGDGETALDHLANNEIPLSMNHGLWPEIMPHKLMINKKTPNVLERKAAEEYANVDPFSEKSHPIRRRRADTGMPEWENVLRNFYFDKEGGESLAEQSARAEDNHKKFWSAFFEGEDHGFYKGANSRKEEKGQARSNHAFSFLGGGENHESDVTHQHSLRLRDFNRWRSGQDIDDVDERAEHLREMKQLEAQGVDLEKAHFDARMRKLDSHDVFEDSDRVEPTEAEIQAELYRNPEQSFQEAKEKLTTRGRAHAHGMGWSTYNLGLEFLSPKERTMVMEHVAEHLFDDPNHQIVVLPDGHRISMSRLKKNLAHRNGAEDDFFSRRSIFPGANANANIEDIEDTEITGDEGMVADSLRKVYLTEDGELHVGEPYEYREVRKPGQGTKEEVTQLFDKTAYEALMDNIDAIYEGDDVLHHGDEDEEPEKKRDNRNLFSFDREDIEQITKKMEGGASLKEALAGRIDRRSDVGLSRDGLMDLVGYNDLMEEKGLHPMFGTKERKSLLSKSVMTQVMQEVDARLGLAKLAKPLRNAKTAHRTHINAPHKDDLPEEQHDQYLEVDGKLRGLAFPFAQPFTHRGGLGKQKMTLAEILHDHLSLNPKFIDRGFTRDIIDEESGLQTGRENVIYSYLDGGESSIIGTKRNDGAIDPNPLAIGATSQLLPHFLEAGVRHHSSVHGIMSKTDTMSRGTKTRGRNVKNADDMHSYTRSPTVFRQIRDGMPPSLQIDRERHPKRTTDFVHDGLGDLTHDNQYTQTSAGKGRVRGDAAVRRNASLAYMMIALNGRMQRPEEALARPYTFKQFLQSPEDLLPSGMNVGDIMSEIPTVPSTPETKMPLMGMSLENRIENLYDELNDPSLSFEGKEEIIEDIKSLMEIQREQEDRAVSGYSGHGTRESLQKLISSDNRAVIQRSRQLREIVERELPMAFHPENPKALANLHALISGAMRSLHLDDGHSLTSYGHDIRRGVEQETTSDMHALISNYLQQPSIMDNHTIGPDTGVDEALEILGLPNDKAHKEYASNWLSTLRGNVIAMSFGKLAGIGHDWNEEDKDMFTHVRGHDSVHDALDIALANDKRDWPTGSKDRVRQNKLKTLVQRIPIHNAMSWFGRNAMGTPAKLDAYGLQLHRPPQAKTKGDGKGVVSRDGSPLLHPNPPGKGSQTRKRHLPIKDIASHIMSFDPAMAPEEITSEMPTSSASLIGGYDDSPIRPINSQSGIVPLDVINDGALDTGHEMTAEFGLEHDGSETVVGMNPQPVDYNTIPVSMLQSVLSDTHTTEHIQSMMQNSMPVQSGSAMSIPDSTGQFPHQKDHNIMNKADLPKEIPLIEPMHRIFELDDMSQLRGFTGEWVVSVHREGTRCKVSKKGNHIYIENEKGENQSTSDDLRSALRSSCKKNFVVDATMVDGELFINDIMMYDKDDVTDLTTRERVKILRGQFDSYHPVHVPSPSDIRVTDEVGLKQAVESLGKENDMLLIRDAKSTYMKGEEKHPKWVMLAKEDILYHIPFTMEIEDKHFILRLPEDIVKYEITEEGPTNPIAAIGGVTSSDYSVRLAKSLEPFWQRGFAYLKKEELEIPDLEEDEGMTDERARRIENQSAGILKPKKDQNILLKPKDTMKALIMIEKVLDKLDKGFAGHYPMSGGRGLGIDVGDGTESPRGPTTLIGEQSMPDYDMKKRPGTDPEKPDDYPGRDKKRRQTSEQSIENDS